MALLFCDSFDHYTNADFLTKWTASRDTTSFVTGRFGSAWSCFYFRWSRKDFTTAYSTLIAGCAVQNPSSGDAIFGFYDAGSLQVDVRYSAPNLIVTRNGTTLGSASFVPVSGQWYYLELKVTFHDTTGIAVLRVDGETRINLSGVDTKATSNATANGIRLGTYDDGFFGMAIDDLYLCDDTGSAPNNDFLGDVRVEAILPSGNGNSSVFVGSDGNSTDNYLLVDENPPNEDTDYVEAATVGNKDTYAFGNVTPTAGTVYGLQILPYARKTDAGTRKIASVARLSGTEVDGPDKTLGTNYQYHPDIRETKPGGGAWTITDVNNAEFGQKVTV